MARSVGGGLVPPPIDPTQIQSHFGDLKGFEAIHELMTIVTTGVPVHAPATRVELDHALKYGNHRSANEYYQRYGKSSDKTYDAKNAL